MRGEATLRATTDAGPRRLHPRAPAPARPHGAPGPRAPLRLALLLGALLLGALVRPAAAYNVHHKLGIGYEETLTALPDGTTFDGIPAVRASGLSLIYHIRHWGLEAVVGGQSLLMSGQPPRWAAFLTLGGHYNLFRAPRVNLSAGLRVTTGVARDVDQQTGAAQTPRAGVAVEGPIRAVFFLSDHFAISAAVGPVVAVNGPRGNPLTGRKDSLGFSLFRGGFAGGLGFTVFLH